jgi:hypothetical protein
MNNNIVKLGLVVLASAYLNASEVQTGKGTIEIMGGFSGLNKTIDADITTYSLVEQHKGIGSSKWFYKYNLTWYDSKEMVQSQSTFNNYSGNVNALITTVPNTSDNGTTTPAQPASPLTSPSIDYRIQGMDINLVVGKDIQKTDENNYIGLGIMLGVSLPWIDSKKDSDNDDDTSDDAMDAMEDSKSEIYTYKIGPSITFRNTFIKMLSIYGTATYAYQTGTFKNSYAKSDLTVNGIFQEYDLGFRFQPVSEDYKWGWLTISPRVYATIGYRYTSWDLTDVNIDITGAGIKLTQMDFNMNSKITYLGFGYSF